MHTLFVVFSNDYFFNSQSVADNIFMHLPSISSSRVCVKAISVRLSQCSFAEALMSELVSL